MKKAGVIEIVDSDEDDQPSTSKRLRITDVDKEMLKTEESGTENQNNNNEYEVNTPTSTVKMPLKQKNRRKSTHQPLRASPDMHFETITLDDDVATALEEKPKTVESKVIKSVLKANKAEVFDTSSLLDIWPNETAMAIKKIAVERVRINYMLESFGMTPISFSLEESLIHMKEAFLQRLKARNILQGLNADINLLENLELD